MATCCRGRPTTIRQPEHVHQLRVATRRAMAALRIFELLLPRRRARKMKKQLKRIRRAAGDARNLDVLAARLEKEYPDLGRQSHAPSWRISSPICAATPSRRSRSCTPICRTSTGSPRRTRALVAARADSSGRGAGGAAHVSGRRARHDLGSLVDQFFAAAAADLSQAAALHAMRICGKRVRYGMEIFAGAFDPALRQEIYPLVVEIQEKLGRSTITSPPPTCSPPGSSGPMIRPWPTSCDR